MTSKHDVDELWNSQFGDSVLLFLLEESWNYVFCLKELILLMKYQDNVLNKVLKVVGSTEKLQLIWLHKFWIFFNSNTTFK